MPQTKERPTSEGAHRSPPKEYRERGATKPEHYADPKNFKYPIHGKTKEETYEFVRAAIAYFCKPDNYKRYPPEERRYVARRILAAAKKVGIEVGETLRKLAGVEKGLDLRAVLVTTEKGMRIQIVKGGQEEPTGIGDRLLQFGRNAVGVQKVGDAFYLAIPKPVIRIGPRGGRITGIRPDGSPEYGGVYLQRLDEVRELGDITEAVVRAAYEKARQENPGLPPPPQEGLAVFRINERGELERLPAGKGKLGKTKVTTKVTPKEKPYGGPGSTTAKVRRPPAKKLRAIAAEVLGMRESATPYLGHWDIETETAPTSRPNVEALVFTARLANGEYAELRVVKDANGVIRFARVPPDDPQRQEGLRLTKEIVSRGVAERDIPALIFASLYACDRYPTHDVSLDTVEIYTETEGFHPVTSVAASWVNPNRKSHTTRMVGYTNAHRKFAKKQSLKATSVLLDVKAMDEIERRIGTARNVEEALPWVAMGLMAYGVDVGTPEAERDTGHQGVFQLRTQDLDFTETSVKVSFLAQNWRPATIEVPRNTVLGAWLHATFANRPLGENLFRRELYRKTVSLCHSVFGQDVEPKNLNHYAACRIVEETLASLGPAQPLVGGPMETPPKPLKVSEFRNVVKKALAERLGKNANAVLAHVPPDFMKAVIETGLQMGLLRKGFSFDAFIEAVHEYVRRLARQVPSTPHIPDENLEPFFDYEGYEDLGLDVPDFETVVQMVYEIGDYAPTDEEESEEAAE